MFWYVFMLCVILMMGCFSSVVNDSGEDIKKFSYLVCWICLFFFAAARGPYVGADTPAYIYQFNMIKEIPLVELNSIIPYLRHPEVMYVYFNKIVSFISENGQMITVANSLLLLLFVGIFIWKQATDKWLSIFLFFTLGFYQTALNLTPSSIASYICMCAIPYAKRNKPIPYLFIVLVASLFHGSAIIFIPLYLLLRIKCLTHKFRIMLAISVLLIGISGGIFVYLIRPITPAAYQSYLGANEIETDKLLVFLGHLLMYLFCWIILQKNKRFWGENQTTFIFFTMEVLFYILSLYAAGFQRVAFLFSTYIIVGLSNIIIKDNESINNLGLAHITAKGVLVMPLKRIAYFFVVIAGIVQYLSRIAINNIGTTMPYKFFM